MRAAIGHLSCRLIVGITVTGIVLEILVAWVSLNKGG